MLIYLSHTGRPPPLLPLEIKNVGFYFFLTYAYELRAFYKCKSYFFFVHFVKV